MATSKLDILINAKNNASGTLKQVSADAQGVGGAAKMAAIGVGALGAAFAAMKAGQVIYDLSRVAEEGQYLKSAFTDMAASAGQSSNVMLDAMRKASSGMVSDVDLIRSANRAMLLGVADDAQEMSQLLDVASKRGRAMGLSTAQAFNDIVTGIGRMSPLILDNLGITLDAERVMADYAKTLGRTADSLSDAEKKQALLNATVAATAGMADPAISEFERMDAAIQNAKQGLGELFSPMVTAIITEFAKEVQLLNADIQRMQDILADRSLAKTNRELAILANSTEMAKERMAVLTEQLETLEKGSIAYINVADEMAELELLLGLNAVDMGEKMVIASAGVNEFSTSLDELRARGYAAMQSIASVATAATTMAYDFTTASSGVIIAETWLEKFQRGAFKTSKATRGVSSAISEFNSELENIKGKVSSVLGSMLGGETAGINADDLLPDPVRLDENARRLADIAVGGFKGQDWMGDFAAEVPDIYQQLLDSADPKGAAAQLLNDFQDGMLSGTDVLIDKEAAKERIKRMILGEENTAAIAEEIAQELASEMGISLQQARVSTGAALGTGGMGAGAMNASLQGITDANVGGEVANTIAVQIEASSGVLETSGKRAGRSWGTGFLETVSDSIPDALIRILAGEVTPLVQSNLAQQASLVGAAP